MKNLIYTLSFLLFIVACDTKPQPYKDYRWDPEIEKLKGDNLKDWISKAPFKGKWDPAKTEDGASVLTTNEEQLFPFIGIYKKEDGVLNKAEDVYQTSRMFFKDDKKGESFVHATLLTHDEELYVSNFYSEMGNVAFSGANAINESYRATLLETNVIKQDDNSAKSGVYWVQTNGSSYCMLFYQKKNLVVQVAFPCVKNDKQKAASKIKDINEALSLNVPSWTILKPEDLEINNSPKSFWKDPYVQLFRNKQYILLNDLRVKLIPTKFERLRRSDAGIDYQYEYEGSKGPVKLLFTKKETLLNSIEYKQKKEKEKEFTSTLEYNYGYEIDRKIYIKSIQKEGFTYNTSETYFKDNSILEIAYSYPTNDKEAKETIENILSKLKIFSTI